MFEHILIATDGSELAGRALDSGLELARALGARVSVLSVVVPLASVGHHGAAFQGLPEAVRKQAVDYLEQGARRTLSDALSRAARSGVAADAVLVENEHPDEAIIETARGRNADLVVMASHGRSGLGAVVLGSVAQKVLTHCKLPVLICR